MRVLVSTLVVLSLLGVAFGHVRQEVIPPNRCLPGQSCFPNRSERAAFAETLVGDVYVPSDPQYGNFVRNVNSRMTRNPAIVVVAGDVADVQKAMHFARQYQLMVTSTAGTDEISGRSTFDGSLQINLSQLTQITTSTANTTRSQYGEITAQAGAIWENVYIAGRSFLRDVVAPSALFSAVGDTVGDGDAGPLVRIHGLVTDNLLEVQLVAADGSLLTVSEYTVVRDFGNGLVSRRFDRELLAAIAAGGSRNFGVVTSYTFKVHLAPQNIVTATVRYNLWEGGEYVGKNVLEAVMGVLPTLPTKWGGYVFIDGSTSTSLPDTKGVLTLQLFYHGTRREDADYDYIDNIVNLDAADSLTSLSIINSTSVLAFEQTLIRLPPGIIRYYHFSTLLQTPETPVPNQVERLSEALLFVLNNPTIESFYICGINILGGAAEQAANKVDYVNPALRSSYGNLYCAIVYPGDGIDQTDSYFFSHIMDFRELLEPYGEGKIRRWAETDLPDWKKQCHGDMYGALLDLKLKYDRDNYLWCHNCLGSDFRINCHQGQEQASQGYHLETGPMLSGYVSDLRYQNTKAREQDPKHDSRRVYINQMTIEH